MKFMKYFLMIVLLAVGTQVQAQYPGDLNNVNIDELSDEQVQQFLDRAKENGLTLDQLELIAKQRGISSTQIAKLRNRIRQIQLGSNIGSDSQITSPASRIRDEYEREDDYSFFESLNPVDSEDEDGVGLKVFGSEIFASVKPSFEPSQNLPTPENYILGPGDEVFIDVYGASEITYQEIISPDGKILISGVGPLSLAGITVKAARSRVVNKLSSIYSGLGGSNPNTFIEMSIGQVRSIKVNVVGNVTQPGTYTLSSFSTVFNALYQAAGPAENGSMRDVKLMRDGNEIAVFDVYKYLFEGQDDQNLQLQDGDIIVVKPYVNRVKIAGSIKNPAIYELKGNETFDYLLAISGGFDETAFRDHVTIDRIGDKEKEVATITKKQFSSEIMQNGDSIFIPKVLNTYKNRVKIDGAVKRPGYYELTNELTLANLLTMANGLREDAYLARGNIIRLSNDLSLKNVAFDVEGILEGDQDIVLSANDLIIVPSIFDLNEEQIVTINGQVRNPGDFPFIDSMTVEDLVNISGGLKEDASTTTIEVARRLTTDEDLSKSSKIFTFQINSDLSIDGKASGFILKPFDLVLIKSTPFVRRHKVIKIEGEVHFPGYYALETNEDKISNLIDRAGGLTQYGYAEGASLIRRTEYYRTEIEKEELEALLDVKRKELEEKFIGKSRANPEDYNLVEEQLIKYEKELTEAYKIGESSDELESRILRAQQLRKLLVKDSIGGSKELTERRAIGIELGKILERPQSKYDLILKDGDVISVPEQLETVGVHGEVLFPNTVRFRERTSFKRYISASGGFSSEAKIGKSYIVYANGNAERTKNYLFFRIFPKVKPGADIIVPQREPRRKLSVQEVLGISSSLVTVALIIDRLSQ